MKPRYTRGQIVRTKATAGEVRRDEMVTVLSAVKATGNAFWYHVKSSAGKTAWLAEHSLTLPIGGE